MPHRQLSRLLSFAFLLLVLLGQWLTVTNCASPIPPSGGPRDSIPPQLIVAESTPAGQTNYRPQEIRLTFEEWVELKDWQKQVVVSPPLAFPIDISIKKRTVIFSFDEKEVLRDSATYVINFGEAVQDLTERNPAEDLRFVFSTGPTIDSARVTGRILDAYTAEPVPDALFLLYNNLADTAVRTERPFYFGRADKEGQYTVSNIRPGTYRGLALLDEGGDYKYTRPTERTGFTDTLIVVRDSLTTLPDIRLSQPILPLRVQKVDTSEYGLLRLPLNQPAEGIDVSYLDSTAVPLIRRNLVDTLLLYYSGSGPMDVLLGRDGVWQDTIRLTPRSDGRPKSPLRLITTPAARANPGRPLLLEFNRPLASVDTTKALVLRDTLATPIAATYEIDSLRSYRLEVRTSLPAGVPQRLLFPPGSLFDRFGGTNADTLNLPVNGQPANSFGNLRLDFVNLDPNAAYVVRLLQDKRLEIEFPIRQRFDYSYAIQSLPPGTYRVEVIEDRNENGRYDAGDFQFGRQPEAVRRIAIEPLRANWDVEATVDLETRVDDEEEVTVPEDRN